MLLPRRTVILLSILTCFLLVLILSQHSALQPTRNNLMKVSSQLAQKVGLGDLDWSLDHNRTGDREQASIIDESTAGRVPFDYGKGKPPGYNFTKVLVVPHTKKENVEWMNLDLPDIDKVFYVADDPKAPLHPPANKGHEVMVYLTYLIDNYDRLPEIIIFMHAHRRAWHNADLLNLDAAEMIKRLNLARVAREGFMNMRCSWYPGCPDWMHPGETEKNAFKSEQILIAEAWAEIFPFDPIPKVLAQPCCSQFALSRDLIYTIPRERFVAWRNWLLNTHLNDFVSGRVWEYMWQFAFTGKSYLCPVEYVCYCDGFGVCFGGKQQFDAYYTIRNERDKYSREYLEWNKKQKNIQDAIDAGKSVDGMDAPEPGKDQTLKSQIQALQKQLDTRLADALERGKDPRLRAEELGKEWHEGDGF